MKYSEINPEKLKMSGSRILVRKEKPVKDDGFEKTDSGILLAKGTETGDKDPGNIVEVVACGPDVVNKTLQIFVPNSGVDVVEGGPGLFLIHQPFAGFNFSHGDYDYWILSEQDVLAVV